MLSCILGFNSLSEIFLFSFVVRQNRIWALSFTFKVETSGNS